MFLGVENIPIADIDLRAANQPRTDVGDITDLARSIDAIGLTTPIIVVQDADTFRLIDGHRRLEACKANGDLNIWAVITSTDVDAEERLEALTSNKQREEISRADELKAIQGILFELPEETIADSLGYVTEDVVKLKRGTEILAKAQSSLTLSFEQYLDLADFTDDEEATEKLLGIESINQWNRTYYEVTKEKERKEKFPEARKRAEAAGAVFIEEIPEYSDRATFINGERITEEHSCGCDGYSAFVDYWGSLIFCCTKEKENHSSEDMSEADKELEEKAKAEELLIHQRRESSEKRMLFLREKVASRNGQAGDCLLYDLGLRALLIDHNIVFELIGEEYYNEDQGEIIDLSFLSRKDPSFICSIGIHYFEDFLIKYSREWDLHQQLQYTLIKSYLEYAQELGYAIGEPEKTLLAEYKQRADERNAKDEEVAAETDEGDE